MPQADDKKKNAKKPQDSRKGSGKPKTSTPTFRVPKLPSAKPIPLNTPPAQEFKVSQPTRLKPIPLNTPPAQEFKVVQPTRLKPISLNTPPAQEFKVVQPTRLNPISLTGGPKPQDRDPFAPPPRRQSSQPSKSKAKPRSAPKAKPKGLVNATPPPPAPPANPNAAPPANPNAAPPANPNAAPPVAEAPATQVGLPSRRGWTEEEVQSVRYKYDPRYAGTPPFVEPRVSAEAEAEARRRFAPFGGGFSTFPRNNGMTPRVKPPSERLLDNPFLQPQGRDMGFRFGRDDQQPGGSPLPMLPDMGRATPLQDAALGTRPRVVGAPQPEPAATLDAQFNALRLADNPKAAVLVTNGSPTPPDNVTTGFIKVQTPQGMLYVNPPKSGLNTPEEVQQYIAQNGMSKLLGYAEEVADTSQGMALVARDAAGNELGSAIVSPENMEQQRMMFEATYPDSQISVEQPSQVTQARRDQMNVESAAGAGAGAGAGVETGAGGTGSVKPPPVSPTQVTPKPSNLTPLQEAQRQYMEIVNKDYSRKPVIDPETGKQKVVNGKKQWTYGADYDRKKDWKDFLRSLGLGFLKGWKETGSPLGGIGSGLTSMFASFFDPNVDNKLQDELIRLPRAMNKYKQVAAMEEANLKLREQGAKTSKAETEAVTEQYKRDIERLNRNLKLVPGFDAALKNGVYTKEMIALVEQTLGIPAGTSGLKPGDYSSEGKEFWTSDGLGWTLKRGQLTPLLVPSIEKRDGKDVTVMRQAYDASKKVMGITVAEGTTIGVLPEQLLNVLTQERRLEFENAWRQVDEENKRALLQWQLEREGTLTLLNKINDITKEGWKTKQEADAAEAQRAGFQAQLDAVDAELQSLEKKYEGLTLTPEEMAKLSDLRLKKAAILGDVQRWVAAAAAANARFKELQSEDSFKNIGAMQEILQTPPPPLKQGPSFPRLISVPKPQ